MIFCSRKQQSGITFLEVLLVIAILFLLASSLGSAGFNFYRNQQFDVVTQEIIFNLRRAQQKAVASGGDSPFGVYFASGEYILFKGNSYKERDISVDEVFSVPGVFKIDAGGGEIIFTNPKGEMAEAKNITIYSTREQKTINVNEVGRVNLQ